MHLKSKKLIAVILGDPNLPDQVKLDGKFNSEDFEVVIKLKKALALLTEYEFIYFENHQTLFEGLEALASKVSLVLNLCDEGYMNDPRREDEIPQVLKNLGLPYTGGDVFCLNQCYDKESVLQIAAQIGIRVPRTFQTPAAVSTFPVLVKPNLGDGSMGITQKSVAYDAESLLTAYDELRAILPSDNKILIQEFLPGKDLSLGIVGYPPNKYEVLPIIEDDYSDLPSDLPRLAGYESKWQPDSPYWQGIKTLPASLPEDMTRVMINNSVRLFLIFNCRDYARFDWRLDAHCRPRLLEVNPNPGWCWDGHLAKMWALTGKRYDEMLLAIINSAAQRYGLK